MTLEEILIAAIPHAEDGKYINIHRRTHDNDLLRTYVHLTSTHLLRLGYTFETAMELGMLWVLDAITQWGMPDDTLRETLPTPEELEQMRLADVEEMKEGRPPLLFPPGPSSTDQQAFEKLLGDIDVPDLEVE